MRIFVFPLPIKTHQQPTGCPGHDETPHRL
jgi:hypothetical protein